jgi:hypothetical protein
MVSNYLTTVSFAISNPSAQTCCLSILSVASFSDCLGLVVLRESLNDIRVLKVSAKHVQIRVTAAYQSIEWLSCNARNRRTPSFLPPTGMVRGDLPCNRWGLSDWVLDVNMATAVLHRLRCLDRALMVGLFGPRIWLGPQTCFDIGYRACIGDCVGAESSTAAAVHVCVCVLSFKCSGTNASPKRVDFAGYHDT